MLDQKRPMEVLGACRVIHRKNQEERHTLVNFKAYNSARRPRMPGALQHSIEDKLPQGISWGLLRQVFCCSEGDNR